MMAADATTGLSCRRGAFTRFHCVPLRLSPPRSQRRSASKPDGSKHFRSAVRFRSIDQNGRAAPGDRSGRVARRRASRSRLRQLEGKGRHR